MKNHKVPYCCSTAAAVGADSNSLFIEDYVSTLLPLLVLFAHYSRYPAAAVVDDFNLKFPPSLMF
jgi:hypothetical protein